MPENPFDGLRRDFQAAETRFGDGRFYLFAVRRKESEKNRQILAREAGLVGWVPTGHADEHGGWPGWFIFGTLYWTHNSQEIRDEAPYRLFMEIATRAGAMLPLAVQERIRKQVEGPFSPASWWVTFLWQSKPLIEEFLRSPRKFGRMIWVQPFRDSANAIEREGLCTLGENPADKKAVRTVSTSGKGDSESDRSRQRLLKLLPYICESLEYFVQNVRANGSGIVPQPDSVREAAELLSIIGLDAPARQLAECHNEIICESEGFNLLTVNGALTLKQIELDGPLPSLDEPADVRRDQILALVERGQQGVDFVRKLIGDVASEEQPDGGSDGEPVAVESTVEEDRSAPDSPAAEKVTDELLDVLRQALEIMPSPDGHAKPEAIAKHVERRLQDVRAGLRELEALGEYSGFARRKPDRHKSQ